VSFFKNLLNSAPKYAISGVFNQQNKNKNVGSGFKNHSFLVVHYCPCPLLRTFANLLVPHAFRRFPASLSVDTGRILSTEESKLFKEERQDKYGHVRVHRYLPYIS
jgi:hypothetical protein